jgi:cytochrome oxidase Cu insertion factor (SCO1/SenC/PrrC family)
LAIAAVRLFVARESPSEWHKGGSMIKEGVKAPDFTLNDDQGKKVKLSDYRGKKDVVLFFYPKANTSG